MREARDAFAGPAALLDAGNYANYYLGEAVVAEKDGGLVLKLGPDGRVVRAVYFYCDHSIIPPPRCPTCRIRRDLRDRPRPESEPGHHRTD